MATRQLTPVLKWAGGKSQLFDFIRSRIPRDYGRYYEPFVGGGAIFLGVQPQRLLLNDINEQLVNLYKQLKDASELIIREISTLDALPCDRERYLSLRDRYNYKIAHRELDSECAALMIWMNKHCFNGLYRVNGKGLFNVPYNNKTNGSSIDEDNLRAVGAYLRAAEMTITCADFEVACKSVGAGDFVYFDSPYIPESATANFTDYTKEGFLRADHERLAALFAELDKRGAKLMLSNNDVPLVHELYAGYKIESVEVKRMINRDASKRTGREVLVMNY